MPEDRADPTPPAAVARRALAAVAAALAVLVPLAVVYSAIDVFLAAFAGVVLAVVLRGLAEWVSARSPLSPGWALAAVALVLAGLAAGAMWLIGSRLGTEADQVAERVAAAAGRIEADLRRHAWGRHLLAAAPAPQDILVQSRGRLVAGVAGIFSAATDVAVDALLVVVLGLYLAAQPGVYTGGAVRLVPAAHRGRAREVLHALGTALRHWALGRATAAAAVGVLTAIGLWAIGVSQVLLLALLAGLLTTIPYIGPITAAVPTVLVALLQGPTTALRVVALYVVVQQIENHLLTPLVQRYAVEMPPAVLVVSVVLAGVLFGPFGLILGAPLTVVAMVLVRTLYVEDTLGDRAAVPGRPGAAD